MTLILASQSASRRAMLDAAGVTYDARPAHVDEASVKDALIAERQKPRAIADALAELKAMKLSRSNPGELVIGSDSVVAIGDRLFDKPTDRADAAEHFEIDPGIGAQTEGEGDREIDGPHDQKKSDPRPVERAPHRFG